MIRSLSGLGSRLGCLLTAAAMTAVLTGCPPKPGTGVTETYVALPANSFAQEWKTPLHLVYPNEQVKGIWLVADTVHVLTDHNIDHAFKSDGTFLFYNPITTPDRDVIGGPVAVTGGFVYATDHTIENYGNDGRLIQSIDTKYEIIAPPAAYKNFVYVGLDQNSGRIAEYDLDQTVHPEQWSFLTKGAIAGAPAIADEGIYAGSDDGSVRAFDQDMEAIWPLLEDSRFVTGGHIHADLRADSFGVYVASEDGVLYCLNTTSGKIRWRYFGVGPFMTPPDVTGSTVYIVDGDKGLVAIDKHEKMDLTPGEELNEALVHDSRWNCPNGVRLLSEDARNAYVLSTSNTILALDKLTGEQRFESKRTDLVAFATNLKDATIYAATREGEIMAIEPILTGGVSGVLALQTRPIIPHSVESRELALALVPVGH